MLTQRESLVSQADVGLGVAADTRYPARALPARNIFSP